MLHLCYKMLQTKVIRIRTDVLIELKKVDSNVNKAILKLLGYSDIDKIWIKIEPKVQYLIDSSIESARRR